jgi:hypothetical protein
MTGSSILTSLHKSYTRFLLLMGMFASGASAQLVVTNWNITGNIVTFDVSGTIALSSTIGSSAPINLYIGVPGDTDWVAVSGTGITITHHGGETVASAGYSDFATGDYIYLQRAFNWTVGNSIDSSIMISGGTLIGANINPADLIISAGYNSTAVFPDTATQVGAFGAVPEPASYAALGGLFALGAAARRRRRIGKA